MLTLTPSLLAYVNKNQLSSACKMLEFEYIRNESKDMTVKMCMMELKINIIRAQAECYNYYSLESQETK